MRRRSIVFLCLAAWVLSPGRASADLTLTATSSGPGTEIFEVRLTGVPDLSSYGINVLFQLPGVSFDAASVATNVNGTVSSVSTTTGAVVSVTLDNGGSDYIFTDNTFFSANLNTVPNHPDELELPLSDLLGTVNGQGTGLIASITIDTSTLTGALTASIESGPGALELLDVSDAPIAELVKIPIPVTVTLSPAAVVPEPSTFGLALLGFGALLYGARERLVGRPELASKPRAPSDAFGR